MAVFSISNVSIQGIAACVPKSQVQNINIPIISKDEMEKFIETTGVELRRVASKDTCTSDLCFQAADKLLNQLAWNRGEVDIVVFVSQTADYILPITSALLQERLGLSKDCIAFDLPLGCSGYVYGLSVISSMMSAGKLKKGLLLVGDTISKIVSNNDRSTLPLFGDAGSATCLTYNENAQPFLFDMGTDGSGSSAIIIPSGGARKQSTVDSYDYKQYENGIERNDCQLGLEGMDVFSFGISQAPKTVKKLLESFKIEVATIDFFVFHQANLMMNNMIVKKLKIPSDKVPFSLKHFGNTSSASIPLTIVTELQSKLLESKITKMLFCGFGVGLSWGSVYVEFDQTVCLDLIEL